MTAAESASVPTNAASRNRCRIGVSIHIASWSRSTRVQGAVRRRAVGRVVQLLANGVELDLGPAVEGPVHAQRPCLFVDGCEMGRARVAESRLVGRGAAKRQALDTRRKLQSFKSSRQAARSGRFHCAPPGDCPRPRDVPAVGVQRCERLAAQALIEPLVLDTQEFRTNAERSRLPVEIATKAEAAALHLHRREERAV